MTRGRTAGPPGGLKSPTLRFILRDPAYFMACGFGSGLSPKAPGTAGSLAAIALFLLLSPALSRGEWLVFIGLAFAVGVVVCEKTGRALGVADHGAIVWDETVGFALVLMIAPHTIAGFLLAFLLFRIFDIWKPFPIGYVDRIKNGFGVMADDIGAALYALGVLRAALVLANHG